MAICFYSCENRSDFQLMSQTNINDGRLPVFYYKNLKANYKIKLIFQDGTEGDTELIYTNNNNNNSNNNTTATTTTPVIGNINTDIKQIFVLLYFVVSSMSVLLLKIILKCIKNRIEGRIK